MNRAVDELIGNDKSFAIAPAGCGKTEVIIDIIGKVQALDKQLVLTHTHAGVHSIINRAFKKGIPQSSFDIFTIDSFSRDYVYAYPVLSGYNLRDYENIDWPRTRQAFINLLHSSKYMRETIAEKWQGIIVDEYQDCVQDQHEIICSLAEILPCRIVGDPLQAIYDFDIEQKTVDWDTQVNNAFTRVGFDEVPVRWQNTAPDLGKWLLDKRQEILDHKLLSLRQLPPSVNIYHSGNFQDAVKLSLQLHYSTPKDESILVIHGQANQCHFLAAKTGGKYHSIEELEMSSLTDFALKYDQSPNENRYELLKKISKETSVGLGKDLCELIRKISSSKPHNTAMYRSAKTKFDRLAELSTNYSDEHCLETLELFQSLPGVKKYRRELWYVTSHTLGQFALKKHNTMLESAKSAINQYRSAGRLVDTRVVGRIRLVKGLEFDHVIIVDIQQFMNDPREAYVALTRAKKSLHIFSSSDQFRLDAFAPARILVN